MSATGRSAMDDAQSAAAQEVRSARACLDNALMCRRQPEGQIIGERRFWLLFAPFEK